MTTPHLHKAVDEKRSVVDPHQARGAWNSGKMPSKGNHSPAGALLMASNNRYYVLLLHRDRHHG